MRKSLISMTLLAGLMALSCGEKKEEKEADGFKIERKSAPAETKAAAPAPSGSKASERIDLTNKGVGPITSVTLDPEVNPELAAQGEAVYNQMCLACHRIGKKFIGPAPNGILERRTPEWVMNMILVPEKMVKEDPLAKDLLVEFNGSPMANQGLTEDQARAVLEYFRTLK
ncbi:c-type cytochrome [Robiginitalea marina]|uniref:Cytochrome c n=1 Tax=Robiginitalea marina TaxID=2954105 RepID=A0ABT1AZM7_9FLAO|nr:cytochrome c [Robiginitalea marina]MCO5725040.1 cytochrome c [Robiginitalea marina]